MNTIENLCGVKKALANQKNIRQVMHDDVFYIEKTDMYELQNNRYFYGILTITGTDPVTLKNKDGGNVIVVQPNSQIIELFSYIEFTAGSTFQFRGFEITAS